MLPTCNLLWPTTLFPAARHTIKHTKQQPSFSFLDKEAIFPTIPDLQGCVMG
jgi:hypothetical protein